MLAYLVRRLLLFIPTLLGVNVLVFALFFFVNTPDHIASQALGEKASTREQIERWKAARGYDMPYFFNGAADGSEKLTRTIFYRKSLSMLWGNLGTSDMTLQPIVREIGARIPPTLFLTLPVFLGGLLLNILLSMVAAARRGSLLDTGMQLSCVVVMSISSMIYIIAGQYVFGKLLRLVPVSGYLPGWDKLRFLVLPIVIGIFTSLGSGIRFYRTLFLEEISKDYVRTARAKGLPEWQVLFLHVLKNALIPIVTNVPMQLLMLIMGSLLLENLFSIPGMGGYTVGAINSQDFSVVRAMVFLGSVLYMLGLLITDLCYSWVDPRVRLS